MSDQHDTEQSGSHNAPKLKIGQLLLKHTSLTEAQLSDALEIQHATGMLLGEILLKKNYIQPHDIIKVMCHQINIPYINEIKIEEIETGIIRDIPITYAKLHGVLPILETDYSVTVAVTDPFKFDAINDLQEIYQKDIKVVVSSPLRVEDAINRVYEKANRNLVDSIEDEFEENQKPENRLKYRNKRIKK